MCVTGQTKLSQVTNAMFTRQLSVYRLLFAASLGLIRDMADINTDIRI